VAAHLSGTPDTRAPVAEPADAFGDSGLPQWTEAPNVGLSNYMKAGAHVVGTDAMVLSGGRSALIVYVEDDKHRLARCIDFLQDPDQKQVAHKCWKLKTP
jgi:hypothetical protein